MTLVENLITSIGGEILGYIPAKKLHPTKEILYYKCAVKFILNGVEYIYNFPKSTLNSRAIENLSQLEKILRP